ncbi:MAG TPA: hypothetical protein VMU43_06575, partial [Candidatus Acidoferrum sp.]|nr:hypothetical protein [Candidatus Acidoferrum sp.]
MVRAIKLFCNSQRRFHISNVPLLLFLIFCSLTLLWNSPRAFGKEHADLIVTNGVVVTMDPTRRIIDDGAIAVRG